MQRVTVLDPSVSRRRDKSTSARGTPRNHRRLQCLPMLLRMQLLLTGAVLLWLLIFIGRLLVSSPSLRTEAELTAKVERQPVSAVHKWKAPTAKQRHRSALLDRPPRMLP